MMAAMSSSICSDYWGSLQLLNADQYHDDQMMIRFQTQQELLDYSLAMNPDTTYNCNINNDSLLFQTYDNDQYSSSSDNCSAHDLYPYFYSPTDNINLVALQSPEIFPTLDHHDQYDHYFSSYHYPKRQKITHDPIIHCNNSNFIGHFIPDGYFNGCAPNPSLQLPDFNGQFVPVSPQEPQIQLQQPAAVVSQLSPQSLAARERRRRITEKTQELGKLIPGGNKMNTAEMLQSAYKYVQFLQAQVSLLKLMASIDQEKKEERLHVEELQVVASSIVQEKLYSEEKCLVSKEFVEILANDHDIQSKPLVKDGIVQLLSTNG